MYPVNHKWLDLTNVLLAKNIHVSLKKSCCIDRIIHVSHQKVKDPTCILLLRIIHLSHCKFIDPSF